MTVLEILFKYFPEDYIDAIVNNVPDKKVLNEQADNISIEMLTLFDWHESREGYDFWANALELVLDGKSLPPLPLDIHYMPGSVILTDGEMHIMNCAGTGINVSFNIDLRLLTKMELFKKEKIFAILN